MKTIIASQQKFLYILIIIFSSILICVNCADPVPDDYIPINLVEALLIVDKPISNIRITKTLPINQEYKYENAIIKDAKCFIYEDNQELELIYIHSDTAEKCGYFYYDADYLVKPNTEYKLKIILANKDTITGTTITPNNDFA
jgi:hypothetical protein